MYTPQKDEPSCEYVTHPVQIADAGEVKVKNFGFSLMDLTQPPLASDRRGSGSLNRKPFPTG
jgi:hypothetical protein